MEGGEIWFKGNTRAVIDSVNLEVVRALIPVIFLGYLSEITLLLSKKASFTPSKCQKMIKVFNFCLEICSFKSFMVFYGNNTIVFNKTMTSDFI